MKEILNIDYTWGEINITSEPKIDWMMIKEETSYNIDIEAEDIDMQDTVTVTWAIE
ncbi:hypothetical protein [Finegoldia magna]|uniref:hypothetical protein n=1 Tax=Finegoldia magna TaxID=1260 RepID=UPI00399C0070